MPYVTIPDSQIDVESPVTEGLMFAIRDNPELVAAGDASVPPAKRILAGPAFRTTEVDTSKSLRPDGAGGVVWDNAGNIVGAPRGCSTKIITPSFGGFAAGHTQSINGDQALLTVVAVPGVGWQLVLSADAHGSIIAHANWALVAASPTFNIWTAGVIGFWPLAAGWGATNVSLAAYVFRI